MRMMFELLFKLVIAVAVSILLPISVGGAVPPIATGGTPVTLAGGETSFGGASDGGTITKWKTMFKLKF